MGWGHRKAARFPVNVIPLLFQGPSDHPPLCMWLQQDPSRYPSRQPFWAISQGTLSPPTVPKDHSIPFPVHPHIQFTSLLEGQATFVSGPAPLDCNSASWARKRERGVGGACASF